MKRGRLIQAASCQRKLLIFLSCCGGMWDDPFVVCGQIPTAVIKPLFRPCEKEFFILIRKRSGENLIVFGLFLNRKFCGVGPITIGQKFFRVLHNLGQSLQSKCEQRLDAFGGVIVNNVKHTNAPSLRANGQHLINEYCNVKIRTTIL